MRNYAAERATAEELRTWIANIEDARERDGEFWSETECRLMWNYLRQYRARLAQMEQGKAQ